MLIQLTSIFGIVLGIISLILAIQLLKQYMETKLVATLLLFLILLGVNQHGFLLATIILIPSGFYYLVYGLFLTLFLFGFSLFFILFLFFEYIDTGYVLTRTVYFISGLMGAIYVILFIPGQIHFEFNPIFQVWIAETGDILNGALLILGILLLLKIIKGCKVIYDHTQAEKLKQQFKLAVIGMIIGVGGLILITTIGEVIAPFNFIIGGFVRGSYPLVLIPALIIIYRAYMLNPYSIFLIAQKIYKLIVFKKNAVTLYEFEFIKSTSKNVVLISGAIHGVSSMLQSALGIESYPTIVKYPDRVILFEFKEDLGFALITDQDSRLLREGLQEFSSKFQDRFKNQFKNWKGEVNVFLSASELVKKSFPFADID